MKTLKFEMAIAGLALFALGAFVATRPTSADAAAIEPAATRAFTEADFALFDRGFLLDDAPCAVGMERYKMCFTPSPLEARMHTGAIVAADVPLVTVEFRVIVETTLKEEPLQTVRFGQSLALVDPESRMVVDMIRLTAPDFARAREPVMIAG